MRVKTNVKPAVLRQLKSLFQDKIKMFMFLFEKSGGLFNLRVNCALYWTDEKKSKDCLTSVGSPVPNTEIHFVLRRSDKQTCSQLCRHFAHFMPRTRMMLA
jgi:hypothetical protein